MAVWLVEDHLFNRCASSELQFGAIREVVASERQGHCCGNSGRVQQRSIGRVRARFGEGGGQLDRRPTREVLSLYARESKA